MGNPKMEKLTCSQCGTTQIWNTPYVRRVPDPQKPNREQLEVWCEQCAHKKEDVLFYGIKQHVDQYGNIQHLNNDFRYYKNHIVLWADVNFGGVDGFPLYLPKMYYSCWTNDGGTVWPVSSDEIELIQLDMNLFFDLITSYVEHGVHKCTSCGKLIHQEEIGGRPLFAGLNCKECWAEYVPPPYSLTAGD